MVTPPINPRTTATTVAGFAPTFLLRFETVRDADFYIMLSLSKLSLNERLPGAQETHLELSSRSDARSLVGFSFSFVCRFSSRRRQIILHVSDS